jgi:hypothetical protein
MDLRAKLKVAAGRRLAKRGGSNPPPIGTWERVGWDEIHSEITWDRCEREERESQAHITTGHFTPIRKRESSGWWAQVLSSLRTGTALLRAGKNRVPIPK